MKKAYTKPALDSKGYAQFENVFTACSKGNANVLHQGIPCEPNVFDNPSSDPSGSAEYKTQTSIS